MPGNEIPRAVAVLDPKREDCNYPFSDLSGCGVGFKFLQGFANRKQISFTEVLKFIGSVVINTFSTFVDRGYRAMDFVQGIVKNIGGEDAVNNYGLCNVVIPTNIIPLELRKYLS